MDGLILTIQLCVVFRKHWRTYSSSTNLICIVELVATNKLTSTGENNFEFIMLVLFILFNESRNLPIKISLSCHRCLLCMLVDEGMQGDKLLTQSFSPIDRSGSHRGHRGLFDVTSISPGQVKIEVSGSSDAITTHGWKLLGFWIETAASEWTAECAFQVSA